MGNQYRKLADGSYGAWIECGYGASAAKKPAAGETVIISTKAGEKHTRVVAGIIKDYASGVVVALVADAQIAAQANARYSAAKPAKKPGAINGMNVPCRYCGTYCCGDCRAN